MSVGNTANSGMLSAMSSMEVISNNISNANTFGFKKANADFADIYSASSGSIGQSPGLGVTLSDITQDFTTGSVQTTNLPLDFAIKNNDFFVIKDPISGTTSYTRAGRFQKDENGYIVNNNNQRLQAFAAINGSIPPSAQPEDLRIPTSQLPALATSEVTLYDNLVPSTTGTYIDATAFSDSSASTYNQRVDTTVYDSLGDSYQVSVFFINTAQNTWIVKAEVGPTGGSLSALGTGTLTFKGDGTLDTATGLSSLSFTPSSGATAPQYLDLVTTNLTQFGGTVQQGTGTADGYPAGFPTGNYNIDINGNVNVIYSNGQQQLIGQIALATFQSLQGLENIGNMSWQATTSSGAAEISQSNSSAAIISKSLESSNVDLTSEMVNLLTAQHNFQANAQVEQAYDAIMQTIIKL